jgi:hypothetical protein
MGVTIENEMNRGELRDKFGIEIADHNDGIADDP